MNLGRKALFVLGFYEPYAPGWGYSPVYIAVVDDARWSASWLAADAPQRPSMAGAHPGADRADAVHRRRDRVSEGRAADRADPHAAGAVLGDYGVARDANSRSPAAADVSLIASRTTM